MVRRDAQATRSRDAAFHAVNHAFSKKLSNLKAAMALHFAHCNFVRIHPSLRVTPAMAAGVSDRLWFIEELIDIAIDGRDAA
jgi:hypothetical protein